METDRNRQLFGRSKGDLVEMGREDRRTRDWRPCEAISELRAPDRSGYPPMAPLSSRHHHELRFLTSRSLSIYDRARVSDRALCNWILLGGRWCHVAMELFFCHLTLDRDKIVRQRRFKF